MQYAVHHLTRFVYSSPVSESMMELRMQPLDNERQHCLHFEVTTSHQTRVFGYRDHFGNTVHCFGVPGHHTRLDVTTESVVQTLAPTEIPDRVDGGWDAVDQATSNGELLDWLLPGKFTGMTETLQAFMREIGLERGSDPLVTLLELNRRLSTELAYVPRSTSVDSPIDEALVARAGVCQDFSHIMVAMVRHLGVPSRYVSGYVAPHRADEDADRAASNATHAWVEVWLPGPEWVGLDPTNNMLAGERHIAVAVGRDYADVPPTRGVFRGLAGSQLSVAVSVSPTNTTQPRRQLSPLISWIAPPRDPIPDEQAVQQQQQQQ